MSTLDQVANFVKVTVFGGHGSTDVSVELNTGDGLKLPNPQNGHYNLVWWNASDYADPADDPTVEIVRCTDVSADTITVTRAQEGTTASRHDGLGIVYKLQLALTAKMITDIQSSTVVLKGIALTGSGTSWTAASAPSGTFSFVIDSNSGQFLGFQGGNYSVTASTVTFTSSVPAGYNSLLLICIG